MGAGGRLLKNIPVGTAPFGAIANSLTGRIYVVNSFYDNVNNLPPARPGTVSVIDGNTDMVIKTLNTGVYPVWAAFDPGLNKLFITNHNGGSLTVIDGNTDTVQATIGDLGSGVFGVAVDTVTHKVYVTARDTHWVSVVDGSTNTQLWGERIYTPGEPFAVAVKSGSQVYVSYRDTGLDSTPDRLAIYYAVGVHDLVADLYLGAGANAEGGMAYSTASNRLYIPESGPNPTGAVGDVAVMDAGTYAIVTRVTVAKGPFGIIADPARRRIYVGNRYSNSISVIEDLQTTPVLSVTSWRKPPVAAPVTTPFPHRDAPR